MADVLPLAATSLQQGEQQPLTNVKGRPLPLVSVIMPVYNGEKYLAEAIESILSQTFTDFEFVIIDDGSEDCSAEIIRSYAERDARIQFLPRAENCGEAVARNAAIAIARGHFVTGMDCDDISLPDRLRKQVDFLQANPQISAVGVYYHVVDENLQLLRVCEPPTLQPLILLDIFVGEPFVHAAIMLRRKLFLDCGGFDESLHRCTDLDLVARLMGKHLFSNVPEALYLYRQHANQNTSRNLEQRSSAYLLLRRRRLDRLWGEAPSETIYLFQRLLHATRKQTGPELTRGERRRLKRDLKRLVAALLAKGWVDEDDRPLLQAAIERKLAHVILLRYKGPRLWQMFRHWLRHNFGG